MKKWQKLSFILRRFFSKYSIYLFLLYLGKPVNPQTYSDPVHMYHIYRGLCSALTDRTYSDPGWNITRSPGYWSGCSLSLSYVVLNCLFLRSFHQGHLKKINPTKCISAFTKPSFLIFLSISYGTKLHSSTNQLVSNVTSPSLLQNIW